MEDQTEMRWCDDCERITCHSYGKCFACIRRTEQINQKLREAHPEIHDDLDLFNPNQPDPQC